MDISHHICWCIQIFECPNTHALVEVVMRNKNDPSSLLNSPTNFQSPSKKTAMEKKIPDAILLISVK